MIAKFRYIIVRKKQDYYTCWSKYSKNHIGTFKNLGGHWLYAPRDMCGTHGWQDAERQANQWRNISHFLINLISGMQKTKEKCKKMTPQTRIIRHKIEARPRRRQEMKSILDKDKWCIWTYDEHHDKWDTACGDSFCFAVGGPKDNQIKFCPYCGKKLKEQR